MDIKYCTKQFSYDNGSSQVNLVCVRYDGRPSPIVDNKCSVCGEEY